MTFWKSLFIAIALTAGSVRAEERFYAQVNVAETNVFLGQVFAVDFIVKAAERPPMPDVQHVADFNMTPLNAGLAASKTNTWLYRFSFRAKKEGALKIPSVKFGTLYSEPVSIHARKPLATDRMQLSQKLSAPSVFVGEPVLLITVWDSAVQLSSIKAVDFHFPILNDPRFQLLELHEPDKESNAQSTGLPVHGTRVLARRKSYTLEEVDHQTLSFSKLLIPKKRGTFMIQPATLLCATEVQKGVNRRSAFQYPAYFDNTFFDQNVTGDNWSRIYAESESIVLDVKPLPTEDRPPLFNGMVGDFTLSVEASPTDVHVGEPITLTITITAADFMENIFFQPLKLQPLLLNRFRIPSDRSLPARNGKSKIYTQTIRPLSVNLNEIPPIQLAFFSPTSNAYITVQSDPIPLTVSAADEIGVFGASLFQNQLRTAKEGIRHNYENPDMLKRQARPFVGATRLFTVLIILLLPPLLLGGFSLASLFGEKKHHIRRTAKAARAYTVFRKNTAHLLHNHTMKSEIYGDLDRMLRAYLGDRLHLNPGSLSFRSAEQHLRKAGAKLETLEELNALFARCEAYRFTADYDECGDAKQIVREANRIVKAVERTLK